MRRLLPDTAAEHGTCYIAPVFPSEREQGGSVKKLLIVASALVLAGCADVAPSAPAARHLTPQAPSRNITCRSGYAVAYNSDGSAYCAPTDSTATTTTTTTTTATTTSTH